MEKKRIGTVCWISGIRNAARKESLFGLKEGGGKSMESTIEQRARKENPLGVAPIPGLIRKFAVPSIIGMLVMAAYNITDQIFIGHVVGIYGNAATNVAFPTVTLTTAFAQMTGIGTAANFNLHMGAKQEEEAKKYVGCGLTLMALAGILIMLFVIAFKTPILWLCGATENVFAYASTYLGITSFGLPFLLMGNAMSNLIRADGSPRYSMMCNVVGAVLNVLLDALFMFGFDWGIKGAAAATITGQIISFFVAASYFRHFKSFAIRFKMFGIKAKYAFSIIKLGTSNFINHIIMMLVNIVLNNMLRKYGALSIYGSDIPLAVSGIAAKLNSILASFAVGLAQGCQPILGFNMGAKNYDRVKKTYKTALGAAFCIGLVAFAAFQFAPMQITSIFGSGDGLYYEFAARYLRIYMMMVCVYSVQPITVNYFTGIGAVKQGILLSLSRQGFFLIPLLLILPLIFGINGVLYAGPIADVLACVLALFLIAKSFQHLSRLKMEEENAFER